MGRVIAKYRIGIVIATVLVLLLAQTLPSRLDCAPWVPDHQGTAWTGSQEYPKALVWLRLKGVSPPTNFHLNQKSLEI